MSGYEIIMVVIGVVTIIIALVTLMIYIADKIFNKK